MAVDIDMKNKNIIYDNFISEQLIKDAENIEKIVESQGSTVLDELQKQRMFYEELLKNETEEIEAQKLVDLIAVNKDLVGAYESYKLNLESYNTENEIMRGPIDANAAKVDVAAIVTYFNLNNYVLSSELLMHAQKNKNVDSVYSPYFGNRVKNTRVIKSIRRSSKKSGHSDFEKDGTLAGNDCYYAIHGFDWTKNKSKCISISDRYDYSISYNYTGIQQYAVNAMYLCQELGHIVPFQLRISNI